ncbi:hypothetical protein LOTGIDRAFT_116702 [Lottia gigantea]|uniref:Vacuolar ATPase assembly protein VMA22 n=1 Tax=Lottia gigantea TaxID=225164 RepID=V3ZW69_LOTGI|nr:hypothetical protein LOTGIDRAFT_116702 [Lottia gigantea]ESO95768.1 hypothetical protein LOTGIDRAFT_116702 [Lottia gigantea]
MELKEVCIQLDQLLMDYFKNLKQLYAERSILDQYMKDGFLNLSRARYNMGVKAVGTSQFSDSMVALTKVDVNDKEQKSSEMFQVHSLRAQTTKKLENSLRNRKQGPENIDGVESGKSEDPVPVDPIKWFGVLVPQNLRKSQQGFKDAVTISVSIANLQQTLSSLQLEYRQLLKTKSKLIKTNDE